MKYIYKILLSVLSLFFIGSACSDTEEAIVKYGTLTTSYSLSGTVKDTNGDPIKGIKLIFRNQYSIANNTTSLEDGTFEITENTPTNTNNIDKKISTKLANPDTLPLCSNLSDDFSKPCYITALDIDGKENGGFYHVKSVLVNPSFEESSIQKQENINIILEKHTEE